MFTPEQRGRLRDLLLAAAHADVRITGAAVTGSAAIDQEDRWSDIDLALCVAADADYGEVIAGWTNEVYATHGAVDYTDVTAGHAVYRVFLLSSTLQVDLAPSLRPSLVRPAPSSGSCSERPTSYPSPGTDSRGADRLGLVARASCPLQH